MKIEICLQENEHFKKLHEYYLDQHPEIFGFVGDNHFYLLIPEIMAERILAYYGVPYSFR